MSKKPGIVERILGLLKSGLSQSAISNELGVPRSKVQSVSDDELGVDPASFKNLTLDDIRAIQVAEDTNAALAEKYNVSPKVISRAKKVVIDDTHSNKVSAVGDLKVSEVKEDGTKTAPPIDLEVGGFADVSNTVGNMIRGRKVYLGLYDEDLDMYLCAAHHTNKRLAKGAPFIVSYVQGKDLTPCDETDHNGEFHTHQLELLASVFHNTVKEKNDNIQFTVKGQAYILTSPYTQPDHNEPGQAQFINVATLVAEYFDIGAITAVVDVSVDPVTEDGEKKEVKTSSKLKKVALDDKYKDVSVMFLPTQVIVARGGQPRTIDTSHQSYGAIVDALVEKDYDKAFGLMDPKETITKFTGGRITFDGRRVTWDGFEVNHPTLVKRVSHLALKGDRTNLERFTRFMDKLFENPSAALIPRVFDFMVYADVEVDDDGDLIVYKSVQQNYTDRHSGKVQNAPGTVVRMPRSFVNDNQQDLCSYGLHVCSLTYLRAKFGGAGQRVVRCKLNPKDIVSITTDFNDSKIRCCEYYVIDDITAEYNRRYKKIDMEGFYK